MKDEMRMCGRCHHEHAVGTLSHSVDGVPLVGPRPCSWHSKPEDSPICGCRDFVEAVMTENGTPGLPLSAVMSFTDLAALWRDTDFLSPQASAETRIAIRKVMGIEDPRERETAYMGVMLANISDIRGAMSKDESKFARLVSHTDEIVDAMQGVTQLSERLSNVVARQNSMEEQLANIAERQQQMLATLSGIAEKLQVEPPPERELGLDDLEQAARRIFRPSVGPENVDEAVVVTSEPTEP